MNELSNGKKTLYLILLLLVTVVSLTWLVYSTHSLDKTLSVRKDFAQEYLMARAVLDGTDPYLPLPELGAKYSFPDIKRLFPHPSAHPPFMALAGIPFALLDYFKAATAWFFLELVLIVIACNLLIKWWSKDTPMWTGFAFALAIFSWEPVFDEMIFGQLNTLLLVLLASAGLHLRTGKEICGGIFLGLAIAIKLLVWPIALYLVLRGRWRSVLATGATAISVNLIALITIGPAAFWGYFTVASSAILQHWRAHEANFSLWSLGWRFFDGAHGRGIVMNQIAPLKSSHDLAVLSSAAIPCLFLLFSFWLTSKIKDFDLAFGIMICVSILFNPVTWSHYLLMTLLPIITFSRFLVLSRLSWDEHWGVLSLSILSVLGLVLPGQQIREVVSFFAINQTVGTSGQTIHNIPFSIGLLTLIPLVAVISLIGLLWLVDRISPGKGIPPNANQIPQHLQ